MSDTKDKLDFIVIGAQKAGTTSLFEYFRKHPELCLPLDKEAPYFSHDEIWARGWDSYMEKAFAHADSSCKWGTITPHYMVGGVYDAAPVSSVAGSDAADGEYDERTVPLRIYERLPHVRLMTLLRDPVERAFSHYQMTRMRGLDLRTFDEAIDVLLQPDSLERSRRHPEEVSGYVTWGEYGRILSGYLEVFPREQILIAFTDELERIPEQLLRRAHEFIGVTSDFIPDNLGARYRQSGTRRRLSRLSPDGIQNAVAHNPVTRALWHSLPHAGRSLIDRRYAQIAYRVELWNQRGGDAVPPPEPATLLRLRDHFAPDAERLATLIGKPPPWQRAPGTP